MKILSIIFLCMWLFLSYFQDTSALSIFRDNSEIIYCRDGECSLDEGIDTVKHGIDSIETERSVSAYIQDIIIYLLWFITILAVLYIIYAWFKILTSAWNDEEVSKSKSTIISVLVWIVIIWLAYSIVKFIINVVTTGV